MDNFIVRKTCIGENKKNTHQTSGLMAGAAALGRWNGELGLLKDKKKGTNENEKVKD